ncbi:hypothetical protein K474DRAFT_1466075 [Panus rudis PR-1116 ss-1]|nr:hypothetical protein K474DRAFT_1466075 [Panus rudis PR-1116 ss-1]
MRRYNVSNSEEAHCPADLLQDMVAAAWLVTSSPLHLIVHLSKSRVAVLQTILDNPCLSMAQTQTKVPELFIAWYGNETRPPWRWHWALVLTEGGYPFLNKPSYLYQITDEGKGGRGIARNWTTKNGTWPLGASRTFRGVCALPDCHDIAFEDVKAVLDHSPAVPDTLSEWLKGNWNCGLWVSDLLLQYGPVWGMDFTRFGALGGADEDYQRLRAYVQARAHALSDNSGVIHTEEGLRVIAFM